MSQCFVVLPVAPPPGEGTRQRPDGGARQRFYSGMADTSMLTQNLCVITGKAPFEKLTRYYGYYQDFFQVSLRG